MTQDRTYLFGRIQNDAIVLNDAGRVAEKYWREIPIHFPRVRLDAFIIMPNHVHGLIYIVDDIHASGNHFAAVSVGANNHSPLQDLPRQMPVGTSKTVGSIVRGFKIGVTKWFRANGIQSVIWQRNYFEHIVRNELSLERIRDYINSNPKNWVSDPANPEKNMRE